MTEISIKQQYDFIDSVLHNYGLVLKVTNDPDVRKTLQADIEILKAIKESIQFEYDLDRYAQRHSQNTEENNVKEKANT